MDIVVGFWFLTLVSELWLPWAYGCVSFPDIKFQVKLALNVFSCFKFSCKSYNIYVGLLPSIVMFAFNCDAHVSIKI